MNYYSIMGGLDMGKNKKKKKIPIVTMSLNEGWDARGWDKQLHYFVRNRAICSFMIRYKAPYFDPGYIPTKEEEYDYCSKCLELLRYRIKVVDTRRFII